MGLRRPDIITLIELLVSLVTLLMIVLQVLEQYILVLRGISDMQIR